MIYVRMMYLLSNLVILDVDKSTSIIYIRMGDCMGCHIIFGLSPGKDTLIFEDSLQVVQDIILAKVSPIILRPGEGGSEILLIRLQKFYVLPLWHQNIKPPMYWGKCLKPPLNKEKSVFRHFW